MKTVRRALAALAVLALGLSAAPAEAGIGIGIGIGVPAYRPYPYYRPYWYGYPYYYRPYPVYVAPAPVVVAPAPAPVVVQPAPVTYQAAPAAVQAAPAPVATTSASPPPPPPSGPEQVAAPTPVGAPTAAVDGALQALGSGDERARSDAAMELGRMRAAVAVDRLTNLLANDRSPQVRETAARALGLIGSPRALNALRYAAQADNDRDVRHSAQFSMEVITSQMRR